MLNDLSPTQKHVSFYKDLFYVYPVVSRRAKGISVGINLSPLHRCSFHCIYCQVTCPELTRIPGKNTTDFIDVHRLEQELCQTITDIQNGTIFKDLFFSGVSDDKKILRDLAFSGDGEPTLSPFFSQSVNAAVKVRREMKLDPLKLVLITNATRLNEPALQDAFELLINNNGEIWAKLDAGTEEYYRRINRSTIPYETVLKNIANFAKSKPLVIQSMFLNIEGVSPAFQEADAWISRIDSILKEGGKLKEIQIYTLARPVADNTISALTNNQMDLLAGYIRKKIPVIPISVYYSC